MDIGLLTILFIFGEAILALWFFSFNRLADAIDWCEGLVRAYRTWRKRVSPVTWPLDWTPAKAITDGLSHPGAWHAVWITRRMVLLRQEHDGIVVYATLVYNPWVDEYGDAVLFDSLLDVRCWLIAKGYIHD
jgi:hypothetical protein